MEVLAKWYNRNALTARDIQEERTREFLFGSISLLCFSANLTHLLSVPHSLCVSSQFSSRMNILTFFYVSFPNSLRETYWDNLTTDVPVGLSIY